MAKNFALIGAGGYIAPRHMKAICDTGNHLVAALDPSDSVGVLDSFSHDVAFFTEFERFDRHAEKLKRQGDANRLHYVSICSPNYLHDAHIRFALRIGADAICEKPLVLNPWNVDALDEIEKESGKKIYNILQLRVHPAIRALKEKIANSAPQKKYQIDLSYITTRGRWYMTSWKGDVEKSGGVATNIGVHFFDMLMWIFGPVCQQEVHFASPTTMAGYLGLEKADVRWFLSVDKKDLPKEAISAGVTTFRSLEMDGEKFEFSDGFADLHTQVYHEILAGSGFGLNDVRPAIQLVYDLRHSDVVSSSSSNAHPLILTR